MDSSTRHLRSLAIASLVLSLIASGWLPSASAAPNRRTEPGKCAAHPGQKSCCCGAEAGRPCGICSMPCCVRPAPRPERAPLPAPSSNQQTKDRSLVKAFDGDAMSGSGNHVAGGGQTVASHSLAPVSLVARHVRLQV